MLKDREDGYPWKRMELHTSGLFFIHIGVYGEFPWEEEDILITDRSGEEK